MCSGDEIYTASFQIGGKVYYSHLTKNFRPRFWAFLGYFLRQTLRGGKTCASVKRLAVFPFHENHSRMRVVMALHISAGSGVMERMNEAAGPQGGVQRGEGNQGVSLAPATTLVAGGTPLRMHILS